MRWLIVQVGHSLITTLAKIKCAVRRKRIRHRLRVWRGERSLGYANSAEGYRAWERHRFGSAVTPIDLDECVLADFGIYLRHKYRTNNLVGVIDLAPPPTIGAEWRLKIECASGPDPAMIYIVWNERSGFRVVPPMGVVFSSKSVDSIVGYIDVVIGETQESGNPTI